MTSYNAGLTLERGILSACKQNWPNFEIIIVDDGSSDASRSIIETFAQKDKRIRPIFHQNNKGFPAALNTIVKNAQGEFIAFFDDDDESRPDRLSKQHERLSQYEDQTNAELVVCYANRHVMQLNGSNSLIRCIGRCSQEPFGEMVVKFILFGNKVPNYSFGRFGSCIMLARRSTFITNGKFDIDFKRSAELDYAIRLAFKGTRFIGVDELLLTQHITEKPHKSLRIGLEYQLQLCKKYKNYLSEKNAYILLLSC